MLLIEPLFPITFASTPITIDPPFLDGVKLRGWSICAEPLLLLASTNSSYACDDPQPKPGRIKALHKSRGILPRIDSDSDTLLSLAMLR